MADSADPLLTPLTVASLIANAQAALLPSPTFETLLHKLVFPYPTLPCYSGSNGWRHNDFVDAADPAAKPSSTFSRLFSLPSLGSILSRTGVDVLASLVGDAKDQVLCDLTSDERAALDKALESFFSPRPPYTSAHTQILRTIDAFWDVCKAVPPNLPDRTWTAISHAYEFDCLRSTLSSSDTSEPPGLGVLFPKHYNTQSIFAGLKNLIAVEEVAGVRDLGRSDGTFLEELEKQLSTSMGAERSAVVLLLDNTRFRPVVVLGLEDSNPSLQKLVDDFGGDGGPRTSLESVGVADPEIVSRLSLGPRLKTVVVRKNYVLVFGAEMRLNASLQSEQQSLLHMLASPSRRSLTTTTFARSQSTPLEGAERLALPLETDSPESVTSTVNKPPTFNALLGKVKAQRATSPSRYRLVTFDELEKGCAFTAAYVGYNGQLVGVHHFPSSAPLEKPWTVKGFRLMQDEAKFYRKNREALEEEQLAPKFVGSWETKGNGCPMRNGGSTMLLLVEEWGQALHRWRDLKGCEAQRHMKELAMRFHLSLQHKHDSLSPPNVVWRPDERPTSLRLIDFARSEPHERPEFREFAAKRRTRQAVKEELSRVATVQQELEKQASREAALWWTVTAWEADGEPSETDACEVEARYKRKASPGREGGNGDDGFESPSATPRQRPAKKMA